MGQVNFKTQDDLAAEALASFRETAVVSKFQAKAALQQAGLLGQVQESMAALPEDDIARLAWEDAQEFRRNSPTVASMAARLGLTEDQIDGLFAQARTIEA